MRNDPEKKPDLKWVKISELYIPTDYQRQTKSSLSLKNINYMRDHFNWADCGALIVCPLKGAKPPQYAVIDGQHRLKAAEAHGGIQELPCVVISEREAKEQAGSFVTINSKRVKLHALDQYRAALVAGESDALFLDQVLQKSNVAMASCAYSSNDTPPRVTQSVGTLLKIMTCYKEREMVWALTIIPDAYGEKKGMLRASMIKAMAEWIRLHPETDRGIMIRTLRELDVSQLEKDARAYRAIESKSMPEAFMMVIEKKYNQMKRSSPGEAQAPSRAGA